ncbi:hypothetical protein AIOGIFDO_01288 [Candidatus Methanoperedenaceae archaeon GB37]|nr:hypothetical protein AIOGIFDO_01288 [Candidatus Methanoperedenaceae archaeon GB37]
MKNEPKKEIWEEIVISNLETQNGKIKVIMADAGFLAYNNILLPLNRRTIPVIKVKSNIDVKKLKKRNDNKNTIRDSEIRKILCENPQNIYRLQSKKIECILNLLKKEDWLQ